jgi:MFS family permease
MLNTLQAGLLMSFYPVASAICAPISGWLSDKISYRPLTVTGLAINTVTLFIFTTVTPSTSHYNIAILMTLLGMGTAIFQSPNNSSIMGSVARNQLGVAGGMTALFRNLGMVSGATLSVLLFNFVSKMNINNVTRGAGIDIAAFMKGFRFVVIFAALSCLCAALISLTRSLGIIGIVSPQEEK